MELRSLYVILGSNNPFDDDFISKIAEGAGCDPSELIPTWENTCPVISSSRSNNENLISMVVVIVRQRYF
jgi:hypothetical protein